jgi:hypothetical protein
MSSFPEIFVRPKSFRMRFRKYFTRAGNGGPGDPAPLVGLRIVVDLEARVQG